MDKFIAVNSFAVTLQLVWSGGFYNEEKLHKTDNNCLDNLIP